MGWQAVEASDIEYQVKRAIDAQARQLTDIPFDKGGSRCIFSFLTRLLDSDRGEIDPGSFPAVLSQVDDVGSAAAARIQRATGEKGGISFDDRHYLWWGNVGISTRRAEAIHQVVHRATPRHHLTTSSRPSHASLRRD